MAGARSEMSALGASLDVLEGKLYEAIGVTRDQVTGAQPSSG